MEITKTAAMLLALGVLFAGIGILIGQTGGLLGKAVAGATITGTIVLHDEGTIVTSSTLGTTVVPKYNGGIVTLPGTFCKRVDLFSCGARLISTPRNSIVTLLTPSLFAPFNGNFNVFPDNAQAVGGLKKVNSTNTFPILIEPSTSTSDSSTDFRGCIGRHYEDIAAEAYYIGMANSFRNTVANDYTQVTELTSYDPYPYPLTYLAVSYACS